MFAVQITDRVHQRSFTDGLAWLHVRHPAVRRCICSVHDATPVLPPMHGRRHAHSFGAGYCCLQEGRFIIHACAILMAFLKGHSGAD